MSGRLPRPVAADEELLTGAELRRLTARVRAHNVPSEPGRPVPLDAFRDHVFGVCLVNDWSARDIQSFEYVPLGPFLGKSFATSVSAWITPLEALSAAWVAPPPRSHRPLPYLDDTDTTDGAPPAGLDLRLHPALH